MARAATAFVVLVCGAVASTALAGGPLFPAPLHITRQVHDSISDKTALLEEYGYGNRLVAVRGGRTSIADYEKGEMIEIDREAGTYSITRFDALARAQQAVNPTRGVDTAMSADNPVRTLRSAGVKATRTGRSADFFEAAFDGQSGKETITVGVDRSMAISKDALEVLLGSAFPGVRSSEHEIVLSAAASRGPRVVAASTNASPPAEVAYGLPVEQIVSYDRDGQHLELRSSVVRLGTEAPPADLVAIPPGARMVTSRIVAAAAELELNNHPVPPQKVH